MLRVLIGVFIGLSLSANAGIISHYVAYKIGQHVEKNDVAEQCKCPENHHDQHQ